MQLGSCDTEKGCFNLIFLAESKFISDYIAVRIPLVRPARISPEARTERKISPAKTLCLRSTLTVPVYQYIQQLDSRELTSRSGFRVYC